MERFYLIVLLMCATGITLTGCDRLGTAAVRAQATKAPDPDVPVFLDVAAEAGITFRQGHGQKRPLNILETTGSGCAFLDYNSDGWPDLFFAGQPRCALYKNNGDGTFTDVTDKAGTGPEGFWIGCATGDYDGDGNVDLLVTGYNVCALYKNNGDGTFTDVADRAGIQARGWQTSAAFADVDRDGHLDLYVCRYVHFDSDSLQYCGYQGTTLQVTCGPDAYEPQIGVFYHNRGDGTFIEATKRFGMDTAHGKAWGAAFSDVDDDGWPDLYVANDEMLGDLFRNTGGGRMQNVGVASGTACNREGGVQGGMGAAFGDYDNNGQMDLVVTTFWMETNSLYRNEGGGLFSEVSYPAGIAAATLKRVGFGTFFADLNNNGWLDLFFVNGHVRDASSVNPEEIMPQRMQLFLNQKDGRFRDVSAAAGKPFQHLMVGRGSAFGDFDNDGRIDVAVIDSEGTALLLKNSAPADPTPARHWLTVRALIGARPRDAIGARITVEAAGRRQIREVQTSGSILSAHDPRVHFGLGAATRVERLAIRWPSGKTLQLTDLPTDQEIWIQEGKGTIPPRRKR